VSLAPFPTVRAPHGMVCSVDHLASSAGLTMLRNGSAADAAIATSAVLAVTFQHACGMGGDLFALVHEPRSDTPGCLNASGRAGSGADPQRLRSAGYTQMPALLHIEAVPIPGCVDGWLTLHERYGRLPLSDVLEPARSYAAEGFPATPTLAGAVSLIAHLDEAADYRAAGEIRPGTIVRRPGVARALQDIVEGGRDAFYGGEFGEGLLTLGGGEYSKDDLSQSQAEWVDPLSVQAFDHGIWTVPPNSQGYLTLAGAWIADGLDLPADPDDPLWAHLLVEASRQAAFDRVDVLHDRADGAALLAPERLAPRRNGIDPDHCSPLPGTFNGGGTIYLCAVDGNRMGVSLIQSNAAGWGSHLVEPSTRIFLQDRGIGFSLEPGHPAEYGPGRRPPHTLSPALVTRADGSLHSVLGTMGGDSQPQVVLQLLARTLRAGQSPAETIAAGRFALTDTDRGGGFATWQQRGRVRVAVEGNAPAGWIDGLRQRGHDVEPRAPFDGTFGHAHLIVSEDGHVAGASDPRPRSGMAIGY
jgi:gamma-glutamyltranspeptidase/glutathione hydrolase